MFYFSTGSETAFLTIMSSSFILTTQEYYACNNHRLSGVIPALVLNELNLLLARSSENFAVIGINYRFDRLIVTLPNVFCKLRAESEDTVGPFRNVIRLLLFFCHLSGTCGLYAVEPFWIKSPIGFLAIFPISSFVLQLVLEKVVA